MIYVYICLPMFEIGLLLIISFWQQRSFAIRSNNAAPFIKNSISTAVRCSSRSPVHYFHLLYQAHRACWDLTAFSFFFFIQNIAFVCIKNNSIVKYYSISLIASFQNNLGVMPRVKLCTVQVNNLKKFTELILTLNCTAV